MKTDIEGIRRASIALLYAVDLKPHAQFEFIIQHPFTSDRYVGARDGRMLDLANPKDAKEWLQKEEELINRMNPNEIFGLLLNSAWYLTWLSFVKPYLSKKDFSSFLASAWTEQENPNMDINVSTFTAIKWFKEADKKHLMEKEDYDYWKSLPEEVTLYRGVARNRKEYGLSWTDDKEKAIWFKNRWATPEAQGRLLKVVVNKKHCLCYLDSRGEKEIVLDVDAVKKDIEDITNRKF